MSLENKQSSGFSPNRRLHYSWEYRKFFNQSEVFRLRECTIFRIPNTLGHFRLGMTLKARGSSVERNRVKRKVREAFRTQNTALGSYDYNVVIPQTKRMDFRYALKLWSCLNPLSQALSQPSVMKQAPLKSSSK